jgi:hypothetical protein
MYHFFSCDLGGNGDNTIPDGCFAIRFANKCDFERQFAIGFAPDNLVSESGLLGKQEITGYANVTAGIYSLYKNDGAGWELNPSNVPGSFVNEDSFTFEEGTYYEYGTDGGAYMYIVEVVE